MRKLLVLAAMGAGLAAAAPAQAGALTISITDGRGGGVVIADGKASRVLPASHRGGYDADWRYTDYYHRIRDGHDGRGGGWHARQGQRGFTYIPGTVRKIQQRTGGKVTDIVFRNGVWHVKGYGRGGRFNAAKVDPYTGRILEVHRARPDHPTPRDAMNIPRLLRHLRAEGFSRFDRVDLKRHVYKVRGLNRRGRPVLITADAHDGHVLNVRKAKRYNLAHGPVRDVKPWKHWRQRLAGQHYSHFGKAHFVKGERGWTEHYRVRARDRHGKRVELRVCAFTGHVLGWRYR